MSIWSQTRDIALQIYALLVGLLVVFLLRSLVSLVCRDLYVSSFYRKHPAAINFINLLLECWNLALSVGTMLARALKHSIIAFYYIGRIDVPTFAPGVGTVGSLHLDSEHMSFKNELLIHESVRLVFQVFGFLALVCMLCTSSHMVILASSSISGENWNDVLNEASQWKRIWLPSRCLLAHAFCSCSHALDAEVSC